MLNLEKKRVNSIQVTYISVLLTARLFIYLITNMSKIAAKTTIAKTTSRVDRVYEEMKARLINYHFRLGERLNEVELAKQFDVSRTPLREVFNRLTAEGWLLFVPNKGFFCQTLEPQTIIDLYEVRRSLEEMSLSLAIERATDEQIAEMAKYGLDMCFVSEDSPTERLVNLDEEFHQKIADLSNNTELSRSIRTINERLHFVRWVALDKRERRLATYEEHLRILDAIRTRNIEAGMALMREHVTRHREEIINIVKESIARLYVQEDSHN
jgi:DNA-binding GntR family transcriptional regulator